MKKLVKLTDENDAIHKKFLVQEQNEWRVSTYLYIIVLYFSLESTIISDELN